MGKILQIRVLATTYRPNDVLEQWPRLCALAWPREDELPETRLGVLQLIDALSDQQQFGEWGSELQDKLKTPLQDILILKSSLQTALSNWNAQKANELSFNLEDALDELEQDAPEID
jgi:hypothetical protein